MSVSVLCVKVDLTQSPVKSVTEVLDLTTDSPVKEDKVLLAGTLYSDESLEKNVRRYIRDRGRLPT